MSVRTSHDTTVRNTRHSIRRLTSSVAIHAVLLHTTTQHVSNMDSVAHVYMSWSRRYARDHAHTATSQEYLPILYLWRPTHTCWGLQFVDGLITAEMLDMCDEVDTF